ncbi:MAG: hypothetical protein JKY50_07875 [Oleispira sp.]|nr:hypothetical protein [Oleispira sp.]MBL4880214.1 hypothetical protein [Oleispira sp.]
MINISEWESCECNDLIKRVGKVEYDVAFSGAHLIDDRTSWVGNYLKKVSTTTEIVKFDYHESALGIGDNSVPIRNLDSQIIPPNSRILIDATTLAFPELLYLFNNLNSNGFDFDVLYVQPQEYGNDEKVELGDIQPMRLSLDGLGPKTLAPYVQFSSRASMLVFLGFEGHRLGSISNSDIFGMPEYSCLLGIPGFKAGWENKAVYNNMSYLSELNIRNILISGANDPIYTYEVIENQYNAAKYSRKNLFLAPLGTKPAGVAAANFAVNNPSNLGIVYDFIQSKVGRSSGTDIAHKWKFKFSKE